MEFARRRQVTYALIAVLTVWILWQAAGPTHVGAAANDRWKEGDVWVHGLAGATTPFPTSQGGLVGVELSQAGLEVLVPWRYIALDCAPQDLLLAKDPGTGRFTTTLHFHTFRLDGQEAVAAPELPCPFPSLHMAIAEVLDAVSRTNGMQLVPEAVDGEIATYRLFITDDRRIPLDGLHIAFLERDRDGPRLDSVQRYVDSAASDFVHYSDVDAVEPFPAATWSPLSDRVEHVDADGDGLISHDDRLTIVHTLPSGRDMTTGLLAIHNGTAIVAMDLIALTSRGQLEWPQEPLPPRLLTTAPGTLRVDTGEASARIPWAEVRVEVSGDLYASVTLDEPAPSWLRVVDADGDGVMSEGDAMGFEGIGDIEAHIIDGRTNTGLGRFAWLT